MGFIKPQHSRKAGETTVRAIHGESDFNYLLNPASIRAVPLMEEQCMDLATAVSLFLKKLAVTPGWHEITMHEAIYQVQKFYRKDMPCFKDPDITREVICLGGALYPGQALIVDNVAYLDEEKAKLRCPNPIRTTCTVSGCNNGNNTSPEVEARDKRPLLPLPKPNSAWLIDLTPKDPMPKEACEKWNRAIQTGSTGVGTAVVGMAGGATLGAATAGGVTVVPSGSAGLALAFNLLHPASQVGALIGLGVVGTVCAWQYFTQEDDEDDESD
ncbi:uncharacterized protein BJX67DRAFT_384206 [Aspergillus lucknowensis]|uniref:Uncharacterized protein n=1 Tax=Aspergillus lucknowensis TaxID=176173 RepID=A0ABR4LIV6_9EURO